MTNVALKTRDKDGRPKGLESVGSTDPLPRDLSFIPKTPFVSTKVHIYFITMHQIQKN
jgi:hypothetical protein